jgi:hypothetical protein
METVAKKNGRSWTLIAIAFVLSACVVAVLVVYPYFMPSLPTEGPTVLNIVVHTWVEQWRNGSLISSTYHPMSLTTSGKDWIADKLFNSGGTNVTKYAMYIAVSASATVFSAAWTAIPSEITGSGLDRALASWADTGTGTGNLTKAFSVSGTKSTQLYGLYYDTYANAPASTLVAAEQQGAGAVKNLLAGDTLTVTVQITVS